MTTVHEAAALLTALSQSSSSSRISATPQQQQQQRSDTHLLLEKLHSLSAQLALASSTSTSSSPPASSSPPSNPPFVLPEELIRRFQTDALRQDTFRALNLKPPKRDPRIDIDGDKIFVLPDLPFSVPKNLDTSTSNIVDALCYEYRLKITDLSHTFSNCLRDRKKLVLQQHKIIPVNKPTLPAAMRSLTQNFQERYDVHVRDLHHQAQSRIERVVSDRKRVAGMDENGRESRSSSKTSAASDSSTGCKKDSENDKKKKKKKKKCGNPAKLSKAEGDKYLVNYYNQDHHPDVESKLALAYKTGRTYDQINTWFANRRTRHGHTVRRDHEQALKTPPTSDEVRGGQLRARQAAQLAASLIPSEAIAIAAMMRKGSADGIHVTEVHKSRSAAGHHPSSPSSTDSARSGCARANNYRRKMPSMKVERDHSDQDLDVCDDDVDGNGNKSSSATISATSSKSSSRASSIPPPVTLPPIASSSPHHQMHKEEEQREAMKATQQNQYPYQQINFQYTYPSIYHPYINHIHNANSYPAYPYPYHHQPILPAPVPSTTRTNYGKQNNHHPNLALKTSVPSVSTSSSSSSVPVLASIASMSANPSTAAMAPADFRPDVRRNFTPYYGHRHILPHQTLHTQRSADERRYGEHMNHNAQRINTQYASAHLPNVPTNPILVQNFEYHSSAVDMQSLGELSAKSSDCLERPEMIEFCGVSDSIDPLIHVSAGFAHLPPILPLPPQGDSVPITTTSVHHYEADGIVHGDELDSKIFGASISTIKRKASRKASEMDKEGGDGAVPEGEDVKRRELDDKENVTQRRSTTGEKELGGDSKETEEDRCVKELDVLPARNKVTVLHGQFADSFSDELFPEGERGGGMDDNVKNGGAVKTKC